MFCNVFWPSKVLIRFDPPPASQKVTLHICWVRFDLQSQMFSSRNGTYSAGCDRTYVQHNTEERIKHIRLYDEMSFMLG